jgi:hypothetical protein
VSTLVSHDAAPALTVPVQRVVDPDVNVTVLVAAEGSPEAERVTVLP